MGQGRRDWRLHASERMREEGKRAEAGERLPGQRHTELLYSEEAACVGGSSHQAHLLFILLLWVAGP